MIRARELAESGGGENSNSGPVEKTVPVIPLLRRSIEVRALSKTDSNPFIFLFLEVIL